MLNESNIKIRKKLLPLSFLYGLGVSLRNRLYDWNLIRSQEFDIPVISVGNITVGGTGKTPHVEYLIRLLSPHFNVAVLSRGYKRKTKGFILADENSDALQIGDEPAQIKRKFPHIIVAVDANRHNGITRLKTLNPLIDVILLDDAFQHRKVKPSHSILLTDFGRPIFEDKLLPAGLMRESFDGRLRADTIIVTKCPENIKPVDFRIMSNNLNLYAYQLVFFTQMAYNEIIPVFPKYINSPRIQSEIGENEPVLVVAGIASPTNLVKHISSITQQVQTLIYGDHHNFTRKDILAIEKEWEKLGKNTIIITTEKDSARLYNNEYLSEDIKRQLYYIPIEVRFLQSNENIFNKKITDHVKQNRQHSRVSK